MVWAAVSANKKAKLRFVETNEKISSDYYIEKIVWKLHNSTELHTRVQWNDVSTPIQANFNLLLDCLFFIQNNYLLESNSNAII